MPPGRADAATTGQNKRRRTDHGRDGGRDGQNDVDVADAKAADEPPPEEDPLRNATTLYVGNL